MRSTMPTNLAILTTYDRSSTSNASTLLKVIYSVSELLRDLHAKWCCQLDRVDQVREKIDRLQKDLDVGPAVNSYPFCFSLLIGLRQ